MSTFSESSTQQYDSGYESFPLDPITFTRTELPLEGQDHNMGLHITVKILGTIFAETVIDNGSGANICPFKTLQKLGKGQSDLTKDNRSIWAFDGSKRSILGSIVLPVEISHVLFHVAFDVLDISPSFKILLGRPWIHEAGAVPSSLHQTVKFYHEGNLVEVFADGSSLTYNGSGVYVIEADKQAQSSHQSHLPSTMTLITPSDILQQSPSLKPTPPHVDLLTEITYLKQQMNEIKSMLSILLSRTSPTQVSGPPSSKPCLSLASSSTVSCKQPVQHAPHLTPRQLMHPTSSQQQSSPNFQVQVPHLKFPIQSTIPQISSKPPTYPIHQSSQQNQNRTTQQKPQDRKSRTFTPLIEPLTVICTRLLSQRKISRVIAKPISDPPPKSYNPTLKCDYHSGARGHSTDNCFSLRHAIQDLIDSGDNTIPTASMRILTIQGGPPHSIDMDSK